MKRALALSLLALAGCSSPESTPNPVDTSPLGGTIPVDQRLDLAHMSDKVDVVRDKWGRPHVYAKSVADAMRVEGYLAATDRPVQLEFYRRVSEGRLAEILSGLSPSLIDVDIAYRHIGLHRTAKAQYDALPEGELKEAIDAYADGVSQAFAKIRSGDVTLPSGVIGIEPTAFTDWTGVDSLAVGRLQSYLLSYDADADLGYSALLDAARSTFTATDPDPVIAARAGLERDLLRFAPADPATTTTGYPGATTKSHDKPASPPAHPASQKTLLGATAGYREAMRVMRSELTREGFGSNNWAIAPSRSATGHAMVASDPHLSLSAPSALWPVSISVTTGDPKRDLAVSGLAFPGIPGIILGHNEHIGWGATVAGYDVSDAYAETLTDDGKHVVYNGAGVALEEIDEVINLQSGSSITYKVQVVPHHGPIVPEIVNHAVVPADPKKGAVSIRWTGFEATSEIQAVFDLLRAKDVDEARIALERFGVGAQNWMLGDTKGQILWTSHANVPKRDPRAFKWDAAKYEGDLPCFILPGDGTAEWTGFLEDDMVPWAKDPVKGYLSTANNDPIGDTLDNDPSNDTLPDGTPMYLAASYDLGFREGKIQRRIEAHKEPLSPEDLSTIQADEESSMGKKLAPSLVLAIERGQEAKTSPASHPDLADLVSDAGWIPSQIKEIHDLLVDWGTAGYPASSGMNPDDNTPLPATGDTAAEVAHSRATLIFNAWMTRLLGRVFQDELDKMGVGLGGQDKAKALLHVVLSDPATLATYDAKTQDSALWDDLGTAEVVETRNERMLRALLDALASLPSDSTTWRWGERHTVTFAALVPLWSQMSIPPQGDAVFSSGFPRHGDRFSIDASEYDFVPLASALKFSYGAGPAQRFVVDLDPAGPKAVNALPGGAVWDPKSPHFRDEAEFWRKNQTHPVPFALADVIAAKESRLQVSPK